MAGEAEQLEEKSAPLQIGGFCLDLGGHSLDRTREIAPVEELLGGGHASSEQSRESIVGESATVATVCRRGHIAQV
jgi:hypothetical protein